jgi:hypothetical protein
MYLRKHSQFLFALFRQFHQDPPAVVIVRHPFEQPKLAHSVNQLHGGVGPNQKEFRQAHPRKAAPELKTP